MATKKGSGINHILAVLCYIMNAHPQLKSTDVVLKAVMYDCDLLSIFFPAKLDWHYPDILYQKFSQLKTKKQRQAFLKKNPPVQQVFRMLNNGKFYNYKGKINSATSGPFKDSFFYAHPGAGYSNIKTATKEFHVRCYIGMVKMILKKGYNIMMLIKEYPNKNISSIEKKTIKMFAFLIKKCYTAPEWKRLLKDFKDLHPSS